jgi:hypothetical protein
MGAAQERMRSQLTKDNWSSLLDLLPELAQLAEVA